MPPEGCTRVEIVPGYPSLDRGSREAEIGFEQRTFRLTQSPSSRQPYMLLETKLQEISEIHLFANKFGLAGDSVRDSAAFQRIAIDYDDDVLRGLELPLRKLRI
ncbi:hypothetical protein T265_03963 [Opisthorchis viverrini]|uniref:Uncharacterized protein n=1 Tax=Opisthorchis viverrini TaxID=6198 RepID=A0A075AH62_OPIVI|nr:hypothetical protein T265_03963 [Opisthorchis viverrini]KER29394.1 hypothetical protein T265_03963 [Opisthorchis viverrini]